MDDDKMVEKKLEILEKGHKPLEEGWRPEVRGGYQPVTSEAGSPPTGGSGVQEPEQQPEEDK